MSRVGIIVELIGAGLAVVGSALSWWWDPRKRARRALDGVGDTPIRELADGDWARVTGKVAALQALQPSPVNQRPCIGYRLVLDTAIRGDPANGFAHLLTRESCHPFSISDETGTAVVEGPFVLGLDFDDSSWTERSPALFKVLDDAGISSTPTGLRFSEAFLLPGDRVTLLGTVSLVVDPAGERRGFREPPLMRRIIGTERTPVMLRDEVEDSGLTTLPAEGPDRSR